MVRCVVCVLDRHTPFLRQSTEPFDASRASSAENRFFGDSFCCTFRLWCVALNSSAVRSENGDTPNDAVSFASSAAAFSMLSTKIALRRSSSAPLYCLPYVSLNDFHSRPWFASTYDAGSAEVAAAAASTDRHVLIVVGLLCVCEEYSVRWW